MIMMLIITIIMMMIMMLMMIDEDLVHGLTSNGVFNGIRFDEKLRCPNMYCNVINFGLISTLCLLLSSKIKFYDSNHQNSQDLHERVPEQDALPRIPLQVSTFGKSIFVH